MAQDRTYLGGRKARKPRRSKKPTTVKALAKVVSNLKREMDDKIELKSYDGVLATTSFNWSGAITTGLCVPSQGVGRSARVGSQIHCVAMDIRYHVQPGIVTTNQAIRVIIFIDRESTVSAVTDVLETAYLGTSAAPLAFFDRDRRHDFIILHDMVHEFDLDTGNMQQWIRKRIPLKLKVQFDDGTALIQAGNIKALAVSNVAASAPTLQLITRTYYQDA